MKASPTRKPKPPSKPADGMSRLVVDIPEKLHRGLKVAAAKQGTTIRDIVIDLLDGAGFNKQG